MKLLCLLTLLVGISDGQTTTPAWNETYPKGQVVRVADFDVYVVSGNESLGRDLSIIVIYDIRGFNIPQTRVFCDRLAAQYQTRVVMPDFFRGTTQPTAWSQVSSDLDNVASWMRNTSPSSHRIALIGFCWGGLQVVRACSNMSILFHTGISIHGSSLTANEVSQLKQPMLFIAAGNDPPLQPNISSVIEQFNPQIARQCEYKTYADMRHGFVAAGANYSDPENVKAIDDVHMRVRDFLDKMSHNSSAKKYCSALMIFFFLFIGINIKP